jgi:hypothetical protein
MRTGGLRPPSAPERLLAAGIIGLRLTMAGSSSPEGRLHGDCADRDVKSRTFSQLITGQSLRGPGSGAIKIAPIGLFPIRILVAME